MSEHTTTQQPAWAEKIQVCEFQGVKKFYDIIPLLADARAFGEAVDSMLNLADDSIGNGDISQPDDDGNPVVDLVASTEARGFLLGPTMACPNNLGFVPLRKPGKTPGNTATVAYGKEYGQDSLELQKGLIWKGAKVLIVDDLLATGGTLEAAAKLIEDQGGEVVGIIVLIELTELGGRELLEKAGYELFSVLQY